MSHRDKGAVGLVILKKLASSAEGLVGQWRSRMTISGHALDQMSELRSFRDARTIEQ